MRVGIFLLIVFLSTASASADLGNSFTKVPLSSNPGTPDGREGGETVADAFIIPAVPYVDTGNTSDNINDYDEICPYTGSTAPDVVYAFTPTSSQDYDIDLCYSDYDTKVYVYETEVSPGWPFACNDDADCIYLYRSKIENRFMEAGTTYYIVVDGYGEESGDYELTVEVTPWPCFLECPPGGVDEGEPELVDGYIDSYNGGCNSEPYIFQPFVDPIICGESGWYTVGFDSLRDTDWYELFPPISGVVTLSCSAEYDVYMYVLTPDCDNTEILYEAICECDPPSSIEFTASAHDHLWVWIGPTSYTGPVYEFDYILRLDTSYSPVETSSWGGIRSQYRNQ